MELFRDINIIPPGPATYDGLLPRGGPDWPDFETQIRPRHCRRGQPIDLKPDPWVGPWETISRPVVWGGILHDAFGHLVAELTTRLLSSLRERPDDLYLFMTGAGIGKDRIAPHIVTLLEWFGLQSDQWRLVQSAMRATELRVAPQAEQLWGPAPAKEHLARLDETARRNGLIPIKRPMLYVSRLGMIPRGSGGHAGESYLVERLQRLDIAVLDPTKAGLAEQLGAYDGAGTIIFAEGSAVHGRQLLGVRDQQIVVLNRRPKERLARTALTARVTRLSHVEATGHIVAGVRSDGAIRFQKGLAIYDLAALFETFSQLGVDLGSGWENKAYAQAVLADLYDWASMMAALSSSTDVDATRSRLADALQAIGLSDHITPVINRIMYANA